MKQIPENSSEQAAKPIDRRVARTRRLLAAALVELVQDHAYETISIRDITDHADIGYATFFRHYESKDALMLDVFAHIITELEALHDREASDAFEQEGLHFFQHVADHEALYRSILDSTPFARKLRERVAAIIQGHLTRHADELQNASIPQDIAAQHMTSSFLGLVDWWLENDQLYTVAQMAGFYERLIIGATWHAMTNT